ncbi:major facilitator superfamily domain-containing protein [Podospora didyma]|uniref:Major facilitator superfamily domain-containing protein n=1 Tax=Podospora didyma TaxID=330526 RepID=A0AAE0U4X0_9PEZI|nr:major facilitator superfamily domain-containing protein [Podospora didyma]
MAPILAHGLVSVESESAAAMPSAPTPAVQRTYPGAPAEAAEPIELQRIDSKKPKMTVNTASSSSLNNPNQSAGPSGNNKNTSNISTYAADSTDLESSRPATPLAAYGNNSNGNHDGIEVEAMQSIMDPYMNRWRLAAVSLMNFNGGMTDSAPGALLRFLELHYGIGYAVVSLIFVGNALGFITAAAFIDGTRERLGQARTFALAQLIMAAAYVMIVCTPPFPLVVVAFFLIGFAVSFNLALGNVFCGSLRNGTTALGIMHGAYGAGGTVGPLIATTMVTGAAHAVWSRYYLITLGLTVMNGAIALYTFWGYDKVDDYEQTGGGGDQPLFGGEQQQHAAPHTRRKITPKINLAGMLSSFAQPVVLLGALFLFAYQGAEVSISGWVIEFLKAARDGTDSVGYVTSGFWGGITLGRFLLSAPAQRFGEKLCVYIMVGGAIVFQLLVWFVPNIIGSAVSVAILGLLLGPIYPCSAAVFMRNLDRSEQVGGFGIMSAFGSSGGAAAPLVTGLLASAVGTFVLHPVAIALFVVMLGCWYGLPHRARKRD